MSNHCAYCGGHDHSADNCHTLGTPAYIGCLWALALEVLAIIVAYNIIRLLTFLNP